MKRNLGKPVDLQVKLGNRLWSSHKRSLGDSLLDGRTGRLWNSIWDRLWFSLRNSLRTSLWRSLWHSLEEENNKR